MPRIGEVLSDRYRIEALLGAGGMASVFRAMDLRLAREVAVKVLAPNLAADPQFAARFDREARALAAIAHPNVVAVFDVEPGQPASAHEPYYVMELCDGGTLGDRVQVEGPLHPTALTPIVAAVAEGLATLHGRGFVHRDVKPDNILFQGGRAKLGDFGLARSELTTGSSPLTVAGTTVGTLPYLAPELLAGADPTPASDVYALGVTTFQALTGQYPKPSGSMREIVEHRHEAPTTVSSILPAIGRSFDAPIGRALAEDPAVRPTAVEFADSLGTALLSLPPSAMVPGAAGAAAAVAASGAAAGAASREPIDRASDTVIVRPGAVAGGAAAPGAVGGAAASGAVIGGSASPQTIASGRASLNPDARLPGPTPAPRVQPRSPRDAGEGAFGNRVLVPAGILLAVLGLAAVVAFGGLVGGGFPGGIGSSPEPGESETAPTETESASPSAPADSLSPTEAAPTQDPAAPAFAALQDVISAIRASQGGKGGLSGRDVTELEGLAAAVADALSNGDLDGAKSATEDLKKRADKLTDGLDETRRAALNSAIERLEKTFRS